MLMNTNEKNRLSSILPPVDIGPFALAFNGQKGCIPSLVNESQIKWTEYPMKKPKLAIGQNIDRIIDKINAVVML